MDYIDRFYGRQRRHSTLGQPSPAAYEREAAYLNRPPNRIKPARESGAGQIQEESMPHKRQHDALRLGARYQSVRELPNPLTIAQRASLEMVRLRFAAFGIHDLRAVSGDDRPQPALLVAVAFRVLPPLLLCLAPDGSARVLGHVGKTGVPGFLLPDGGEAELPLLLEPVSPPIPEAIGRRSKRRLPAGIVEAEVNGIVRAHFPVLRAEISSGRVWAPGPCPEGEDGQALQPEIPALLLQLTPGWESWASESDEGEIPSTSHVLDAGGVGCHWLEFEWDGLGPNTSSAYLNLLSIGGTVTFVEWAPEDESTIVAALEPKNPEAAALFLKDAIGTNGVPYGTRFLVWPPTRILNRLPALTSRQVVKQAFAAWLEAEGQTDPELWAMLRDEMIERSEQPDHLQRCLDLLRRPHATWKEEKERRVREGLSMTAADRRITFENYFDRAYWEVGA